MISENIYLGNKLKVTGLMVQATGNGQQATGSRLRATGYRRQVSIKSILGYIIGN
jgi:hypothetical protein